MSSDTKSLSSGGTTRRSACGSTTWRIVCAWVSPSARAAARWLGCTERMPERITSATYAAYVRLRAIVPRITVFDGSHGIPSAGMPKPTR